MATTRYFSRTNVIVLVVFLLIVSLEIVHCGRRRRRTSREPEPTEKPKRPNGFFDKGGIKTFGKIAYDTYIDQSYKPSIRFNGGSDRQMRPSKCHECLSIDGSDKGCETGSSTNKTCEATTRHPYCSTEYGITNENLKYVLRSCNGRLCDACKDQPAMTCNTVQCDMCNSNSCNEMSVDQIFTDAWSGCVSDPYFTGPEFSDDDTCGAMTTRLSGVSAILAGLTIVICTL